MWWASFKRDRRCFLKRGVLAIYDIEINYASQLMDFLNRKQEFILEARVFTKLESLEAFVQNNAIEILLASETFPTGQIEQYARHTILLCEGKLVKEEERYPVIYKFQSAENIMRELLAFYVANSNHETRYRYVVTTSPCEMIGVFSPCGGCRQTTFALALGQALGERKRVLYINLELCPGIYYHYSEEFIPGFSELIYFLKQKRVDFSVKLQSIAQHIGSLDYIVPPSHYNDLYELEIEDIYVLVDELQNNTTYEAIIFDIGFQSEAAMVLLELCHKIYMPTSSHIFHKNKEKMWLELLEIEGREKLYEKLQTVIIPYDSQIDCGDFQIEHLCMGELGRYIYSLIDTSQERK